MLKTGLMVKMQFYITGIIYILKYFKIENSSTVKMLNFTVFNCISDLINAALLDIRDLLTLKPFNGSLCRN